MARICPDKGIKGIKRKNKKLSKCLSSDFDICLEQFLLLSRISSNAGAEVKFDAP